MNILLSTLFHEKIPFMAFYDHMCRWFVNLLPQSEIDVRFLIDYNFVDEAESSHLIDGTKKILLSKKDIQCVFDTNDLSINDITAKVIYNSFTKDERKRFNEIIKEKCSDWVPDVILSQGHINGANLYGDIFPNALCLSTENAIFSRPPFNRTLSYDPYTAIPDNFLVRFSDDIKSFKISDTEDDLVERFKKSLTGIIDKNSPLDDVMNFYYKQKFNKLVLLPLVGDRYIRLFKDCICENEFDLVETVMKNMPSDVGVFVTQADAYASLTPDHIKYFSSKYPNFIFLQQTDMRGYANNSLNYFKYIDAVLNITSKTGFMAMLWDKPVISLAAQYNKWYQDGYGVKDFERVLNMPYKNKNNVLYWYFTRYVLFYEDFNSDGFLYNFLTGILAQYRKNGIDFNFYQQINDFNKIFDYVLQYVITMYTNEKKSVADTQNQTEIAEIKHKIISLQDWQDNMNFDEIKCEMGSLQNGQDNMSSKIDNMRVILQNYIDGQRKKSKNAWYKKLFSVNKTKHHRFVRVLGAKFNIGKIKNVEK